VLRYQSDRRNPRKLPDQVADRLNLLGTTAMDRDEDRVDWALSDDSNCIGKRVPVYHRKAAAPCGIHSGPLDW
jgi:hypothetical protein